MTLRITFGTALCLLALVGCGNDPVISDLDAAADLGALTDTGMNVGDDSVVVDLGRVDAGTDAEVLMDLSVPDASDPDAMVGEDLGPPAEDLGTPAEDLGTPELDAGTPEEDLGTPDFDAGMPAEDLGTPEVDAGTPEVDAGTPVVDAGALPDFEILDCGSVSASITIVNNGSTSWNPSSTYIAPMEIVRWNVSLMAQTVTSGTVFDGTPLPNGNYDVALSPGQSLCIRFNKPGSYPYYSSLHTNMTGFVTVLPPSS